MPNRKATNVKCQKMIYLSYINELEPENGWAKINILTIDEMEMFMGKAKNILLEK